MPIIFSSIRPPATGAAGESSVGGLGAPDATKLLKFSTGGAALATKTLSLIRETLDGSRLSLQATSAALPSLEFYNGPLASSVHLRADTWRNQEVLLPTAAGRLLIEELSMAYDVHGAIDRRIAGRTADATNKNLFSTYTTPSTFVRSATHWAADIDLTAFSVYNSVSGDFRRGVAAISPLHGIVAEHFPVDDGATVKWVDSTGAVITRTIATSTLIGSTDIRLVKFSSALPSTITPLRVLPNDHASWSRQFAGAPCLKFDQDRNLIVSDIVLATTSVVTVVPSDSQRAAFWESLVAGDSGQPVCVIIGREPVLLGMVETSGQASSLADNRAAIDAAMTAQGGGYTTTAIDGKMFWEQTVRDAKLKNRAGLSVMGRSVNTTGTFADILASTDHHVLRRFSTSLGFGLLINDNLTNGTITAAKTEAESNGSTNGGKLVKFGANGELVLHNITTGYGVVADSDSGTGGYFYSVSGPGLDAASFTGSFSARFQDASSGSTKLTIGRADGRLQFLGSAGAIVLTGAGTPEGAVTAAVGSLYLRTNGGAGTILYLKESGAGNTGWVPYSAGGGSGGGDLLAANNLSDVASVATAFSNIVVNDAVTNAKLANMAEATIKGRAFGAGTGDPTDLTAEEVRAAIDVWSAGTSEDLNDEVVAQNAARQAYFLKSADYTAVKGDRLSCDTSGGVFVVTLPASPSSGDIVVVADARGTWDTNNLTLNRNGQNLDGVASNKALSSEWGHFICVFNATYGWRTFQIGNLATWPGATHITTLGTVTTGVWNASAIDVEWYATGGFQNTGLKIRDTNNSHFLFLVPGSDLTNNRQLIFVTGDADRTITLSGDTTLAGTNTGDQTITLTSDVTGSGTGSFAATIAVQAVTYAKMQNIATDSLIGRDTAGSGAPETIGLNSTLSFDGSGNLRRAALAGDVTSNAGSNTLTIADGVVTLAKMADMATASFIGRDTGGTGVPEILTASVARAILSISNVTNTSDANKPVSTAQQTALDLKANLAGGNTFTGTQVFPSGQALIAPALGTPASLVATNVTGTAASLTAGNVTTNANLTGHVTSTGNAAVLGSFTLAQLSTAVSDADVARTDAAQTLTGVQTFSSAPIVSALTASAAVVTDGSKALASVAYTGAGNVMRTRTGVYRTIYVNAGAMIARTTAGAATGTVELATNDIMFDSFDFDTTTEEGVGFWITMPREWDAGTVKFVPHWTAASGSGTAKFDFAARAYADDDAMDQALGTEQGSTDTLITANDMHIGPATAALTIGGSPAAGRPVYIQVTRDTGGDTLTADAKLLGVEMQYLENSSEPASL